MSLCKIHNVGFYTSEAKAIYCMALQETDNKLAVSRSDASIEIWNLTYLPFIEKTIPATLENFSIQGLCFFGKRLFSTGLHGLLIEYDLNGLHVKNKWTITGEAGTCLDIHKDAIAVGTEQGFINIYRCTDEGAEFEKFLDKQEGRLVCLKFSKDGRFVVAGSINAIRIWDMNTGHALHKMVLGRTTAKQDTVVWCLEVLSDFTIFSGDSRGVLTLWDGRLGAQIESFHSHKADITTICVSKKEDSIYCAGVDPTIINYVKVNVGSNVKWVKSIQRKIHSHDVRAMVVHNKRLYSSGIDSYLSCSYHPPKTLLKYAPIPRSPCVQVAAEARRILLRYSKHIEIWSLGQAQKVDNNHRGPIQLLVKPEKLVVMQRLGKNWADEEEPEAIITACITSDGQCIFIATPSGFRLYSCEIHNSTPKITKIDDIDDSAVQCIQAAFNEKFNQLIVTLSNGSIIVYDLENGNPFIIQRIEREKSQLTDTVSFIAVSGNGKYFVVADCSSNIVIFKHTDDGYSYYQKLPKYQVPPTALNIDSVGSSLVIAYADNKILEYNISKQKLSGLSTALEQERDSNWKPKTHPIRSITFDSRDGNKILLHDDTDIIVISRRGNCRSGSSSKGKIAKLDTNRSISESSELTIKTIQRFKHLVHLEALDKGELIAVEVNPLSILEKLPPAFDQKTFGAK